MRPIVQMLTECILQRVSKAIYAGCCSLQGCLSAGFVLLRRPMGARGSGS